MRGSKISAKQVARRIAKSSAEAEIYTPERPAEFFLKNAMDSQDYVDVRKEAGTLGFDPDTIKHQRWPA
ncbi:MAG: hypothetical protein ABSF23_12275 [Terracidiphilus sp.]